LRFLQVWSTATCVRWPWLVCGTWVCPAGTCAVERWASRTSTTGCGRTRWSSSAGTTWPTGAGKPSWPTRTPRRTSWWGCCACGSAGAVGPALQARPRAPYTHTRACTRVCTHPHTRVSPTHARIHPHTRPHKCTHAHTRTHSACCPPPPTRTALAQLRGVSSGAEGLQCVHCARAARVWHGHSRAHPGPEQVGAPSLHTPMCMLECGCLKLSAARSGRGWYQGVCRLYT
jgi:hypothetical protein